MLRTTQPVIQRSTTQLITEGTLCIRGQQFNKEDKLSIHTHAHANTTLSIKPSNTGYTSAHDVR